MKVGLGLGAGGLIGIAWLMGAIEALRETTGWDPGDADHIVGTSAGSIVGALVGEGEHRAPGGAWPPEDLRRLATQRPHPGLPAIGPGSWRLAASALTRPAHHTPLAVYSALLPRGVLSLRPVQELVRSRVPGGWSSHPGLWIVACDYATGKRVAFGRDGSPKADLADAVAASCAIPGTYRPVRIAGRTYVDGGMYSASNLDLLRHCEVDVVVCLNPTSSRYVTPSSNPLEVLARTVRTESGRRLGRESKRLRELDAQVVLVQPTRADLAEMGVNLMSRDPDRQRRVFELARRTVAAQLAEPEHEAALALLPQS